MRQPPENVFVERFCISDEKLRPLKIKNGCDIITNVQFPGKIYTTSLTASIDAARDSAEYASICSSLL
jgi:hypothetical protein